VPEMVRSSWMAKKFTRGMTYQWKAKDMVSVQEDLYGVVNIVIYHYNEQLLKCRGSRGIGVPEQKSDIVKTLKMLRLRVFWPPWHAPYHQAVEDRLTFGHDNTTCCQGFCNGKTL
jgi:hypothetical protein